MAETMNPLIRFVRSKGWSQLQFARAIGRSQNHISNVLNGKVRFSAETARRVCELSGGELTLDYLLFGRRPRKWKRGNR
jgi:transcriptional regulator with XRE-family HTH domain